jgi:hypothetical protein
MIRFTALAVAALALAAPASAQTITMNGVARSVSLMRALAADCPEVIPEEAERFEQAFIEAGRSAFGQAKFDAEVAAELPRRDAEVRAAGAAAWCAAQRATQLSLGNRQIFRNP